MTAVLLGFQTAIWLALTYAFLRSRSASVFHPFAFYLAFHGMVFVIRPIMEHVFHFEQVFYSMEFYPTEDVIQFTLVLTSFALIVFAGASWLLDSGRPRFDRELPSGFGRAEWQAYAFLVLLIGPIALYSAYAAIATTASGDPLIQMDRDPMTGVAVFTNTTGYFAVAQEALGTLCLMLIWGNRFRPWSFVPFLLYLTNRVYLGWGRWTIILTLMMLGLLYLLRRQRRWIPVRFVIIAIPVFIVFQQLGENRETFQNWVTGEPSQEDVLLRNRSWIERQDSPDFANFDFLTYVVDAVPAKSGTYTYFTDFLQIFTEPIPRMLWPDKPFGPPIQLVDLNAYGNFVGWTLSVVGMGWMSAGWVGVIVMMAAVGLITARLHRWFWSGEASNFKILAYCIFAPLTLQWYRDGDISITKFVFVMIGPLALWMAILKLLPSAGRMHSRRTPPIAVDRHGSGNGTGINRPTS
jgi:hypothetical protein